MADLKDEVAEVGAARVHVLPLHAQPVVRLADLLVVVDVWYGVCV
jgi:hypothetical protein